jgi:hypothetical protein
MKQSFLILLLATSIFSCEKDDNKVDNPPNQNEQEVITSVIIMIEDENGAQMQFAYSDPDGDGGNPFLRFDTVRLAENTAYSAKVLFLDESKNPTVDLTDEIQTEASDHQVFYNLSSGLNLNVTYNDVDTEGRPLGIHTSWDASANSTGVMTILLKHQPGIKANAPGDSQLGETDVELPFYVEIQ